MTGYELGENIFKIDEYNRRISVVESICVQEFFRVFVALFEQIGIHINLDKTKAMVCTPGFLWVIQGVTSYKRIFVEG